jgi:SAM-dependent methyltransferase
MNKIEIKEYSSYEEYVSHQKSKAPHGSDLHKALSKGGSSWDSDCSGFRQIFSNHKKLLASLNKGLCLGARTGQEVAVLQEQGLLDTIGIDLNDDPPLVIEGDVHDIPFTEASFDFIFSNIFDHVLYPDKFISEIERVLVPGGYCLLHVDSKPTGDAWNANTLYDVEYPISLFKKDIEVIKKEKLDLDVPWPDHTELLIRIQDNA